MKVRYLLFLFISILPLSGFSQDGSIKGQVTDAVTGETLIGANVLIQGTLTGTITDLDGNYELKGLAPGKYNIVVSYISYDKQILQTEVSSGCGK